MKVKQKLLEKRKKLYKEMRKIGPFIEGTLTVAKRTCGSPGCKCRTNLKKKHPGMYLTWKEKKKTKATYVPVAMHKEVLKWKKNHKKLKKLLKQISDIQRKILTLR